LGVGFGIIVSWQPTDKMRVNKHRPSAIFVFIYCLPIFICSYGSVSVT
jgi:hypothetical protein